MPTSSAPPPSLPEHFETYARRKFAEHEKRIETLEDEVGEDPNVAKAAPATGIKGRLEAVSVGLDKLTNALDADREERAAFRAMISRLAWGLGIPLGVIMLTGIGGLVWHWASTLHH